MITYFRKLDIATGESFSVIDVTESIATLVTESGIKEGTVLVTSMHTTCALSVNENEVRLFDDIRDYFLKIAPADQPYKHNDLHLRVNIPPDEPENAHAHLIAMMVGNSEIIAIHAGELVLGQYQSVLMLELDGPRDRKLAVQLTGE